MLYKIALIACIATSHSAFADNATTPGATTDELSHHDAIHWVDVAQIEKSLEGQPPMAVGFDVDDTVLFSSPCFFYGQQKYSPGKNDYLKNPAFWADINANCDINYSLPKDVAVGLYRCCQEAVNNSLRHSGASRITVDIVYADTDVYLTVEDNGKGFDPGSLHEAEGRMMSSGCLQPTRVAA